ncbi:MAG TPA: DUF6285 domain-containing protein [Alphaproteobacteria bacterium]|jgi:hypothetical protein|nr:DUF6285 domain-containing protein [Alphaproteobacteria bacterium]MDP6271239.1 DUF6285 domain-containing protein [Alphaproteobacteria bacterium]HJM51965.1 DUF6285 domain-containing protein [Alphaproteobacteria bacterium]
MPTDLPDAVELLTLVQKFLRLPISPTHAAEHAYHSRVASNVLKIVERDITEAPAMAAAAAERLAAILEQGGDLAKLNAELARRLRRGEIDIERADLKAHLRQTARDKVALVNPKYAGAPRA